MFVCLISCFYLVFVLTIAPGLKLNSPYFLTLPLVDKNCASKALGLSSARMLILERIFWKDIWDHQRTDACTGIWFNCLLQKATKEDPLPPDKCQKRWRFTSKAVSMTCRILDESSCSRPTSAMGKYSWSFYTEKHTQCKKINPWPKLMLQEHNFNDSWITKAHRPCSTCRSGWWQQRWGWCCVCPADGPAWVLKGSPGAYPLYICRLRPGGRARRCAAGCLTAR